MAKSPFRRLPGEDLEGDLEEVGPWQEGDAAEVLVWWARARAGADVAEDFFEAGSGVAQLTGAGGIASGEALGTATLRVELAGAGAVAPGEAFGAGALACVVGPASVPGGEALEEPHVARALADAGALPTTQTFGAAQVVQVHLLVGAGAIPSEEVHGVPDLDLGGEEPVDRRGFLFPGRGRRRLWTCEAGGVASAEAFGVPLLEVGEDEEALALTLTAVFGGAL